MHTTRHPFLLNYFLPFIWLAALIAYILAGTPITPFHGDESTLIFMSRDYAYEFIQHDLSKIYYSETPVSETEQRLRLLNGTVSKDLIGLAWHLSGFTINDLNEQWDWGADWNYNQQNGHAPSEALLQTTRWSSAVLLAAGVVVMFALGDMLGGKPAAYAASLYYALNPALLLDGRRAMMEGSFIFFSLLVVLAGAWLATKPSLGRAILLGLAAGLAIASKHTAVFTVGTVYVTAIIFLVYQSFRAQDDASVVEYLILPYLIIAAVLTGVAFYLLNPSWWGDPLNRARTVLELRQDLLNIQTQVFGHYADLSDQVGGFLRQALLVQPQYYEVPGWDQYIGDQIARYEASGLRGVSVGGTIFGAALLCVMITIGLWGMIHPPDADIAALPSSWQTGTRTAGVRWMVAAWALVTVATTLLLTPLEWQRYYLPVYLVIGVIAGVGVSVLYRWGLSWMKKRA